MIELFNKFLILIKVKAPQVAVVSKEALEFRSNISGLQSIMEDMPQAEGLVETHHFSNGVYARELFIPKGTVLIGKIHKHENLNILSQGDITVYTEDGPKRVQAPATIVSKPGTKRLGYAHEDCVWTCIHKTDETDLVKIEEEIIAKDFDEIDMILSKNKKSLKEAL